MTIPIIPIPHKIEEYTWSELGGSFLEILITNKYINYYYNIPVKNGLVYFHNIKNTFGIEVNNKEIKFITEINYKIIKYISNILDSDIGIIKTGLQNWFDKIRINNNQPSREMQIFTINSNIFIEVVNNQYNEIIVHYGSHNFKCTYLHTDTVKPLKLIPDLQSEEYKISLEMDIGINGPNIVHEQEMKQQKQINELLNHSIMQQDEIDELRRVVDALVGICAAIENKGGYGYYISNFDINRDSFDYNEQVSSVQYTDTQIMQFQRVVNDFAIITKMDKDLSIKEELAAIRLKKAKDEKAAAKKKSTIQLAEKKAATIAKMTARLKAFEVKLMLKKTELEHIDDENTPSVEDDDDVFEDDDDVFEELTMHNTVAHAAIAELRLKKEQMRGCQQNKKKPSSDPSTWSIGKADRFSKGWCE